MSDIDWSEVAELFSDALEEPPDRRSDFVAARCADRPAVRDAVHRLLEAQDAAGAAFLRELDLAALEALVRSAREPPTRVGPYRLVGEIGTGGMGQVFLAERADGQFQQRVAIKLLKLGMDSEAILARFLRERQILARLEHPNIARLIDGGVTQDGRPYFVMEYVEGLTITRFCDHHRLTIDDRLRLFVGVCSAVEYAHRNLVVHRDLKPSNILVTKDGQPKLLDFGIATVLSDDGDAGTPTVTDAAGGRVLTPDYAAPEQFRGGPITTATDVYGAGAVLYELLAGRRPFPPDSGAARMRNMDDEPPPLSTAIGRLSSPARAESETATAKTIAAARATDAGRLRRRLGGDLDMIAATALRTAPERRYASIAALREDIQRHQERLPVKARSDGAGYRISRFVRRHRVGVIAAGSIVALVLAFAITSTVQAARIRRQAAELEVERDRARREAAAAQQVSDFLVGVFEVADPMLVGGGDSIRATELLDRGAERIETELAGQPHLQARMLGVIGRAYDNLMRSDRAEPLVQRALALHRTRDGEESAAVVATLQQLAGVKSRRGDYLGAEAALAEALAIQDRRGAGKMSDDPLTWALLVDLASIIHGMGDYKKGAAATAEAGAMFDRISPGRFGESRAALARMAQLLSLSSDSQQTNRVYERLAAVQRATTGARSVAVAAVYTDWGITRRRQNNLRAADSILSLAMAIHREHDSTSVAAGNTLLRLADVAVGAEAYERADTLYRAAIDVFRQRVGEDHRFVAVARTQLAETLHRRGRYADAVPLHEAAIATYRRNASDAAILLPPAEGRLGVALRESGRPAEAVEAFESGLRGLEARFAPDYLLTANLRRDYGATLVDLGRAREAEPMLRRAIAVLAKRWGDADYRVDAARVPLARALTSLRRYDEANELLGGVLRRVREAKGEDDPLTRRARDAVIALDRARARRGS